VAIASLVAEAGYVRWKGHDLQPRPYDGEDAAVDRVVRSILAWEACAEAAGALDTKALLSDLSERDTAGAEDRMREAVVHAQEVFMRSWKDAG
jgi:xylose isomerase